jgi:F-type H+-transporting ATPase subunit a
MASSHGEHSFTWLSLVPGLEHTPNHVVMAVGVVVGLTALTAVASLQLKSRMKNMEVALVPEPQLTYRNFFEILAEKLYGIVEQVLGKHEAPVYFPLIGTLFVFIFTCNLFGLIPGFLPPTDNLNTTIALSSFVFLYYNYRGLKANGLGYLKHFMGPVWWLAPLMLAIEIISHLIRPVSLAFRLKWNITGDHIVMGVFSDLVPLVVPVVFFGMGAFVSLIQAFVFCMMTMVYISLATAHDH